MKRSYALALSALLLTGALMTGCGTVFTRNDAPNNACPFSGDRQASIAIGGVRRIRIDHSIGDLKVIGQPGATELKATGKACATSQALLDRIQLKAEVQGDEVRLTADLPQVRMGNSPLIDITVALPNSLPLVVAREVGDSELRTVASLDLHKGVGTTAVDGVTGDVTIDADTGATIVRNVKGNARVRAIVGDMTIQSVDGDVTVPEMGTGTIRIWSVNKNVSLAEVGVGALEIRNVKGDLKIGKTETVGVSVINVGGAVLAESFGVGDLEIRDVKGDLTIRSKGTGDATYTNIGGKLDVPKPR